MPCKYLLFVSFNSIIAFSAIIKGTRRKTFPKLSEVLGIRIDELLSDKESKRAKRPGATRLERRMKQIEKLPAGEKKLLLQIIDAFIERATLKSS